MTSTTKKHRDFVGEPMGHKSVRDVPGIGDNLGRRLENKGFNKASDVLGQYLHVKQDTKQFGSWLKNTSGANSRDAGSCTRGLNEWCDNNL
uniref:barrier-to-autointegration factor-like n=1 Tax=Semicossyphus pulcher TaxID=241346 RepID=UPI0037E9948F